MKKTKQKTKQLDFFKKEKASYGGVLRSARRGRQGARKLSTQHSMHMVLRSTKAKATWSFALPKNRQKIAQIITKHAKRNFITIISLANVGNHLHLHIKLQHRAGYKAFVRAVTGAIALTVMGASKTQAQVQAHKDRFWDYRPFTTIITSFRHFLSMQDYMQINRLEGLGFVRTNARLWQCDGLGINITM